MSDEFDTSAVDTAADDSADLSADVADDSSDGDSAAASTPAAEKLRLKWLNREEEIDDPKAELSRRFSDDYEYEFRGPKGAPVKAKWADIERHVQRSSGAENAIRAAQEERKSLAAAREWGKKNPHAYLQRHLGIQDPEQWALDVARKRFEQETEIANLMANDPIAAQQKLREIERTRLTQAQEWEKQEQETRAQSERAQQARQANEQKMAGELQRAGIKPSRETMARAAAIIMDHRQLDIELTYDQVAGELRKQMRQELLSQFDEDKDWLSLLGDKRRERLRQLEIEAVKKAKKEQKATAPKAPVQSTPTGAARGKGPADINSLKIKWGGSL